MISQEVLKIPNIIAFLSTISYSEGTNNPNGYNTIFGGTVTKPNLFTSFADHPRKIITINGLSSDAAGRYQIMSYVWDELKKDFIPNLPDFSPSNQDLAACQLLSNYNSLDNVCNGQFAITIDKLSRCWASFPCADKGGSSFYSGQPSHSLQVLQTFYLTQGGTIT